MNETYIKYASGALLYVLWAGLVIYLKLDPSDLISTIKWGLLALFGYHAVSNLQRVPLPGEPVQPAQRASVPVVPLKEGI